MGKGWLYEAVPTQPSDVAAHSSSRELFQDIDNTETERVRRSHSESCWRCNFVESDWFHVLTVVIVVCNVAGISLEFKDEEEGWRQRLFWADQLMLAFYIFEIFCRGLYFRERFFCGGTSRLLWNLLDVVVVTAGVLDQWIIPMVHQYSRNHHMLFLSAATRSLRIARLVRIIRIFRIFKFGRILWEAELDWSDKPAFTSFIGIVISLNACVMGLETDWEWCGWIAVEQVFLLVYVFELVVRFKRHGCGLLSYQNNDFAWNCFDVCIVITSIGDVWMMPLVEMIEDDPDPVASESQHSRRLSTFMMLLRTLRLMRILRLVRLVKAVRPLYILVVGVLAAMQGVFWVLVLTVTVLYGMAIMATRLIGHGLLFDEKFANGKPPDEILFPFKSVPDSMFTLFRIMNGANSPAESEALDFLMASVPVLKFAFVYFMVTSSWALLSILTAVVSDNMISTTTYEQEALKMATAEADRRTHLLDLNQLFAEIDTGGNGLVDQEELLDFLRNDDNAQRTAQKCRVPVRSVNTLLEIMYRRDKEVTVQEFTETLVDSAQPTTERSILQLEIQLDHVRERLDRLSRVLLPGLDASPKRGTDRLSTESRKSKGSVCEPNLNITGLPRGLQDSLPHCLRDEISQSAVSPPWLREVQDAAREMRCEARTLGAAQEAAFERQRVEFLSQLGVLQSGMAQLLRGGRPSSAPSASSSSAQLPGKMQHEKVNSFPCASEWSFSHHLSP